MRLAVVASHPIQYYAPLYRRLARSVDVEVFYSHRATAADHSMSEFGVEFEWDLDLLSGYRHVFLQNTAVCPGLDHFGGCDTPEIGIWLRHGGFDAVVIQGWHFKAFIQAAFAAKRLKIPALARGDSHLGTPRSALTRAAKSLTYPVFLRLFDGALVVGERSRAYWARYHYPATKMFFAPHCVDADWFEAQATGEARARLRARLGVSDQTKLVLFAGKLVPRKRPLDLVLAAARLKREGLEIELLVAGAGPLEPDMRLAAEKAGVTLHMLGFCNQREMPAAYAAADLLALPSEIETWGLVANEALASGRPLVLSDAVGSAPDLVGDGTVGCAFPVGDVVGFAESIKKTLANRPTAHSIRAKSSMYSLDAAADGIIEAAAAAKKRTSSGAL